MRFTQLASYLQKIEQTSSRNKMVKFLAQLFSAARPKEAQMLSYLVLGRLGPSYSNPEFGLATKMMQRVLARAYNLSAAKIAQEYQKEGDLGNVAQKVAALSQPSRASRLSLSRVFEKLSAVAQQKGSGSQERKIDGLARLLQQLDPLSAKYVVRIPVGKLRLGFSDATILDALSWMEVGNKSKRKQIEHAYNVSADIGKIAWRVKKFGVASLEKIAIEPGTPIRMAAAERLTSAKAIINKLGKVAAEPKIDGFRLQVHQWSKSQDAGSSGATVREVKLYSRNLDNMTAMFPEIVQAVQSLGVKSIIFEGEAVAFHPETEEFLPFQETMQRRRKYDIAQKVKKLPLKLFAFDLLYLNGESLLNEPYAERRGNLERVIGRSRSPLNIIEKHEYDSPKALQNFFLEQVEHGLEGIMAKRLDAPYTAGARNFNWVKLKREEKGELEDTIDCLVMGYKFGTGKRTRFGIGAFLVGVYDQDLDFFRTISNVGTGLTDEQWRKMKLRADALSLKSKPARYDVPKELEQDVWLEPAMVVEILADEITRSPMHTAGKVGDKPGFALRFPRLVRWRDDKKPEQATTVREIESLFRSQKTR